ncbi:XRE family transcriptional regulator [Dethiosulfatarculus sandiegensis]|uniref:XRE family transcriptional regulator n=1 Tax=Dethiosulfatarculus sandiegensis TaxID=1429043 RepID=A0A0D2GK62_9BACT|nr:XRE family transcriptional regulator [Dethiosulfatarculus sandiegensis]
MSVLLVEDDLDLAATVVQYLELEGMSVACAFNGDAGLNLASEQNYQVLLLDVMLPRMDGLTLCSRLRKQGVDLPVLMLTARDTLDDKLAGFRAGTDDYLVKPFAMAELVARIKVLAQRRSGQARKLKVGELVMDLDQRQAHRGKRLLKLTPTCWDLLETMMRRSPEVVSRRDLEQALWGADLPESNTLKVHMHKLRQQVDDKDSAAMIHTVTGHGFMLK